MKALVIIVRPNVVPRLVDALFGLPGIDFGSIKEVRGYGRQKSYLNEYQGSEYSEASIPKVFIDIRVHNDFFEPVIAKIIEVTRTGRMGDGKIFVFDGTENPCFGLSEATGSSAQLDAEME